MCVCMYEGWGWKGWCEGGCNICVDVCVFFMLDPQFSCTSFQWVQNKYESQGWTQHHEHLLEFEECNAENAKPSISVRIAEPANQEENNWEASIISAIIVSHTGCLVCLLWLIFLLVPLSPFLSLFLCVCVCLHLIFVCCSSRSQWWIS